MKKTVVLFRDEYLSDWQKTVIEVSSNPIFTFLNVKTNRVGDGFISLTIESNEETIKDYISYLESKHIPLIY